MNRIPDFASGDRATVNPVSPATGLEARELQGVPARFVRSAVAGLAVIDVERAHLTPSIRRLSSFGDGRFIVHTETLTRI